MSSLHLPRLLNTRHVNGLYKDLGFQNWLQTRIHLNLLFLQGIGRASSWLCRAARGDLPDRSPTPNDQGDRGLPTENFHTRIMYTHWFINHRLYGVKRLYNPKWGGCYTLESSYGT